MLYMTLTYFQQYFLGILREIIYFEKSSQAYILPYHIL